MIEPNFENFASEGVLNALDGPGKVAALFLAMDRSLANKLLQHFDEAELRDITRAAAQLRSVSNVALDEIINEFEERLSTGADLLGGASRAEDLLTGALPPERAAGILNDVFGRSDAGPWNDIINVPEEKLVAYLTGEHPQTAAYILSNVDIGLAGRITATFQRDFRNDILRRMLSIRAVEPTVREIVGMGLKRDLLNSAPNEKSGNPKERIAEIVNSLDPMEADSVMEAIVASNPKEGALLKTLLFSFEDLRRLSTQALAIIFDKVPAEVVVLALRGTEQDFRDIVLAPMASRGRRLVESELNNGATVSPRDVAKARRTISSMVLTLARRNEIEMPSPDPDVVG